jgi:hypothetical protein
MADGLKTFWYRRLRMKFLWQALGICCCFFMAINTAYAVGLGFYGSGGGSISNWKYKDKNYGSSTDYWYGGGLVVDTAVAKSELFNYRFTAGYEQYGSDSTSLYETKPSNKTAHKFDMSHMLGFALYQTKEIRFWAGPEIGLHCLYSNDFKHVRYSILAPLLVGNSMLSLDGGNVMWTSPTKEAVAIGLDALLDFGINYNIGEYITIFASASFGYFGTYYLNANKEIGNGCGVKAKIGILFRIRDSYDVSPVAI